MDDRASINPRSDYQAATRRYVQFLQAFTADDLGRLEEFFRADVRFSDPLQSLVGIESLRRLLARLFVASNSARVSIVDHAVTDNRAFVLWELRYGASTYDNRAERVVTVCSHLVFARDGRIAELRDVWDTGPHVYERMPLLGGAVRMVRRVLK